MTDTARTPSLTWVHFGDLHMTQGGEQNHRDFLALVYEVSWRFKPLDSAWPFVLVNTMTTGAAG